MCRCAHGALLQYSNSFPGLLKSLPTMLKRHTALSALFSLATLSLAGCLGYRTPMLDPNAHRPGNPQTTRDAAPDLAPKDESPGDSRSSEDGPSQDGSSPDSRTQDARPQDGPSQDGRAQDGLPLDSRPDLRPDGPARDAQPSATCQGEKRYVLVLGDDGKLYRFDANTLTLTSLATVACAGNALNSMTVSPIGPAYISSMVGDLCSVDMKTFQAASTAFSPSLVSRSSFGMALLPDNSAAGQTLYIAVKERNASSDHLERIDLSTFELTSIGYVSPASPSAELTAGPNGELDGFAVGTSQSLLLNIDPTTASAIDITTVPAGFAYGSFALVYWQDGFYLFLGGGGSGISTVYRYVKGDPQVSTVGTVNASIIGAGVACANN